MTDIGYVNIIEAVRRATSAEVIDTVAKPSWSADRVDGQSHSREDRMTLDVMVHTKLRRMLPALLWNALVAKYSASSGAKAAALEMLLPKIDTLADARFTRHAAVAWSFPRPKGKEGKRSTQVLPTHFYDFNTWDTEGRSDTTRRRWNKSIQRWLDTAVNQGLIEAYHVLDEENLILDISA